MSERVESATEQALIFLMNKSRGPFSLLKIAGREVYCEIINLIKHAVNNEHVICFCYKYHGCATYHYSDKIYACANCQLIYDFYPYYMEQKIIKDLNALIKTANEIYLRLRDIAKIGGECANRFSIRLYRFENYEFVPSTIWDIISPNQMF